MSDNLYLAFEKFAKDKLLECECCKHKVVYNETEIDNMNIKIILTFLEKHVIYEYIIFDQIYKELPKKISLSMFEDCEIINDPLKINGWDHNKRWRYAKNGSFSYIATCNSIHEILLGIHLHFIDLKTRLEKIRDIAIKFDDNPKGWDESFYNSKAYSVVNKFPSDHTAIFLTVDDCKRLLECFEWKNNFLILATNDGDDFIAEMYEEDIIENENRSVFKKVFGPDRVSKEGGLKEVLNKYTIFIWCDKAVSGHEYDE
ncbi:hypothetical protein SteCoe_12588 [Stentor coeruleus]|uniref:Uncharacterized protein n=1 Tax=Stentor coeruleus TaxID=5963 RepID=A0A1R2CAC4_9CILI|nr:hypothetical protein SteCoe_12588 [Stentor coeruleus]